MNSKEKAMPTSIGITPEACSGTGGRTSRTARPQPPGRGLMTALALSMLLSSFGTSSANVALPALAAAFDTSFGAVQWIVIAYLLAITTLIVGIGRLGDVVGRRRVLLAGTALFTAASLMCAGSPTLWLLIGARAMQGVGAAAMMALTLTFAAGALPKAGRAMGLLGTMSAAGTALGPSLGGLLVAAGGWSAIFLANIPLGLLALYLGWRHLPHDRPAQAGAAVGFDRSGTLLLAATLGAYAFAMTTGGDGFRASKLMLLAAACLLLALFVRAEKRSPSPLIDLASFRDPALVASLAASTLVAAVLMATLLVGPFYLSSALGLSTVGIGLVLAVGPVCAALTALPAGHAADRFGTPRTALAGLSGVAAGSFLLAMTPPGWGLVGYLAPMMLITSAYSLFQTANNTSVMAGAQPDRRGVVSAMLNLSRNLGLVTGATLLGAVFAAASGASGVAAADASAAAAAMRTTFLLAGGLVLIALAFALWSFTRGRTGARA